MADLKIYTREAFKETVADNPHFQDARRLTGAGATRDCRLPAANPATGIPMRRTMPRASHDGRGDAAAARFSAERVARSGDNMTAPAIGISCRIGVDPTRKTVDGDFSERVGAHGRFAAR